MILAHRLGTGEVFVFRPGDKLVIINDEHAAVVWKIAADGTPQPSTVQELDDHDVPS